jgi:hypothetical protein
MSSTPAPLPHADYQRFESMRQYEAMLDELIPQTQRVVRVFDRHLSAAYNGSARCELLREFMRADPLNRLFIIVHESSSIERDCPRFATLLQRYGHKAQVRQTPRAGRHLYDPFVIFDATHYLHRFHYDHMRYARGLNEVDGTQQLLDRFGELWEVSTPAAATGVVGL